MTKKETMTPPPLRYMFEQLMSRAGLWSDSKDWRELTYSFHVEWLKPFLDQGYIVHRDMEESWPAADDKKFAPRKRFNYHHFDVTPSGIQWWATERVREIEKESGQQIRMESIVERIDGKGLGAILQFYWSVEEGVKGIRDGYFEFVKFYSYRADLWLTVTLTESGMRYFDSIPRLVLECA